MTGFLTLCVTALALIADSLSYREVRPEERTDVIGMFNEQRKAYGLKPVRWSESIAQSILALDIQWCSSFTPSQLITSEACDEPCEHWFVMLDDRPATALANPSTYDPTLPTFDKDTIEPPEYRTLLQNSMDALPQMWNCPMNGGRNSVLEEGRVLDSWRTFMSQEVEILGCVAYSGCEAEFEHVHQYLYCGAPGHPKIRMRPFSANRCQYFPFTKFQSTTWKCESYNTRLNPIKRLHTAPLIGRNASMTHCLAECVRHKDNGCRRVTLDSEGCWLSSTSDETETNADSMVADLDCYLGYNYLERLPRTPQARCDMVGYRIEGTLVAAINVETENDGASLFCANECMISRKAGCRFFQHYYNPSTRQRSCRLFNQLERYVPDDLYTSGDASCYHPTEYSEPDLKFPPDHVKCELRGQLLPYDRNPVVVRSNTPYECAVSCKTHPGCNAFSFKDTGECMLTNGLGAILLDDKSSMRGKMSCYFSEEYSDDMIPQDPHAGQVIRGLRIKSGLVQRLSGLTLDECIYACYGAWRTLGCRFVNYDVDCELLSSDQEMVEDHFNIIGPMSTLFPFEYRDRTSSPQGRCVKSDFGIVGGDKFRVTSLEKCAATCKGRHENLLQPCYYATFDGSFCYLHISGSPSTSPGNSFIDASCWSPETYVQPERRCIMNGKNSMAALVDVLAPSLEVCLEICTQQLDQGCRAVSFGSEICSLYHDCLGLVETPDTQSVGEVERLRSCAEMKCWFAEIDLHPSSVAACTTPNVEVDGHAFKSTHTPTFLYCARSCAANAKCAAFTFKKDATRCTFHGKTSVKPLLNAIVGHAECFRRLYPKEWPFLDPVDQGSVLIASLVIGILVLCSALFAGIALLIRERRKAKKQRELEQAEMADYHSEKR